MRVSFSLVATIACLITSTGAYAANLVLNPSFEGNQSSFTVFPGYISGNTTITDWTASDANRVGINGNAGSGNPFADNGVKPDGVAVSFIQSAGGATTLSQSVTGLSIGTTYKVTARLNRRNGSLNGSAVAQVTMGTETLLTNQVLDSVGGANPYRYVTFYHTAGATSETLTFQNQTSGGGSPDTTILVDAVSVDSVFTTGWSASPWSNDATSGIDAANPYSYSHAYNLGSASSPVINGVTFQGVAGGNPSVLDKFTVTGMGNVFNGFGNSVTDPGSNQLASDFIYGGNPGSITINGLVSGVQYLATFYGVSFGGGNGRAADFSVNGDRLTADENALPAGNGVKLQYSYTADITGSVTLNVQPYNGGNSIHFHGFANEDQTVTGLFNTGTDANRVSLADNTIDPHWSLTAGPVVGNGIVATSGGGFPIGPWNADNSISAWVTPATNTEGPAGSYTYETTFNVSASNNLNIRLQGLVAADDGLLSIFLNGNPMTTPAGVNFGGFTPFDFIGLATPGSNTLQFVVSNDGGPSGLRVQFTSALAVPEPGSFVMLSCALAGLAVARRRRAG